MESVLCQASKICLKSFIKENQKSVFVYSRLEWKILREKKNP